MGPKGGWIVKSRTLLAVWFLYSVLCLTGCKPHSADVFLVEVESVMLDPRAGSPVLLLVHKETSKVLPVWVGPNEAKSIAMELEGMSAPRPLTHDLLKRVLDLLDARLERVVITDLREDTYFAVLVLRSGTKRWEVDSRPSDAVALALRCRAPIYVSRVLQQKGALVDLSASPFAPPVEQTYGFSAQDVSPEVARYFGLPDPKGVLITDVDSESRAARSGLRRGDILVKVEREPVADLEGLRDSLSKLKTRRGVRLEVSRGGTNVLIKLDGPEADKG